jgi:hypothetical protein
MDYPERPWMFVAKFLRQMRAARLAIAAGIWCAFGPRQTVRLAAVQVRFEGGVHWDYLIPYMPAWGRRGGTGRPGGQCGRSRPRRGEAHSTCAPRRTWPG